MSVRLAGLLVLGTILSVGCAVWWLVPRERPDPPDRDAIAPRPVVSRERTAPVGPPFTFDDVAAEAGLNVPHYNAANGQYRLVETMGSGVGLLDHDRDGWLDIFVAQGCPLPRDPGQTEWTARLYRNQRDGSFEDVTDKAGVGFNGFGQGVAVGDYDGDGHDDLYVSALGTGALYRNQGDGTFRDVTEQSGLRDIGWGTSCAFADLDRDQDLDLFVVHYLANTVDEHGRPTVNCDATPGRLGYCPPGAFSPEHDRLFRNNGDGTFTDVSAESGVGNIAGNGLGLAIADWDDDGRLDVFVANDQSPNHLWRNLGDDLRFEEVALSWGVAYDEAGHARAGMGVASGDYDGDGRSDLLVTNFYEEGCTLYRNRAPGDFQVTTTQARLAIPTRRVLGFGTGFLDIDHDGRLDLFAANGHINDVRPLGMPYEMPPQLFRNVEGTWFEDVSQRAGAYFQGRWLGRGAAFGDLDNDGDMDIVVTHLARAPALLRNDVPDKGHFLSLSLNAKGTGRHAVGARVTAHVNERAIVRELVGGASYLSASEDRVHIGLGTADHVDRLEVRWPSGVAQEWRNVSADQVLEAREGQSDLRRAPRSLAPTPSGPSSHTK